MRPVDRTTPVEALVEIPGAVRLMIQEGLPCLICGEAAWGTVEELARDKGKSDEEIGRLLHELNRLAASGRTR